jgi:hypothetical protein
VKTLLEEGKEAEKQSNNNDSVKIMGLSVGEAFTSGFVIVVVVSFALQWGCVFPSFCFIYPFVR